MSEFIAGAFVDVKPEVKDFRTSLQRALDAEVKKTKPLLVPVDVDAAKLKTKLNNALKGLVKVEITPTINKAEFRKSVKDQAKKALDGLKITIPVDAQAKVAAAGGAAGTGGTGGAGRATKADADVIDKATGSRKRLTEAEKRADSVKKALAKSDDQARIASTLLASATEQNIKSEERSQRLTDARNAASRSAKAATDALAISEGKLTDKQKTSLQQRAGIATSLRQEATEKKKALSTDVATRDAIKAANDARLKAAIVTKQDIKGITSLNALHIIENDLNRVGARLKRQTNAASEAGISTIVRQNDVMSKQVDQAQRLIVARRDELRGEGVRAKQQKTAQRGALATALSLLGVRGATLAANSAFLIGAASAALFAKSLQSFANFETELNTFQAIAGATASQMAEVSKRARELGADVTLPAVTAADAAQAMTELSRAGLDVRESMDGARGVLELAAAAQITNAEAATLTASALNAFGLSGDQAVHVADLLANAANAAQGSIAEMGAAMQQASAIARQVGLSLDNTVAILTIFARNGLRGSDAGTSLRTALSRLIAPTKDAAMLIEQLGINVRDAQGNIRPDVFAQFGEATKDLSPALRDMIAQTIAGQDAIRAFSIGAREGARGLKAAQLQMQQEGAAARVAAARTRGLAGSFSALSSNTQTLGTQLGAFAAGPVKVAVSGVNDLVSALNLILTGDFDGILEDLERDFDQFGRNMARHAGGLKKVFSFGDLRTFGQGVKETFTPAGPDPETERIQNITEALERLNSIRVQVHAIGGNIEPFTEQIQRLRGELKAAKVDAGLIIPVTPLEKALAPLEEARRNIEEFKKTILAGDKQADVSFLNDALRNVDVRIKLTTKNFGKTTKKAAELSGKDIARSFRQQFQLIAKEPDLATPEVLAGIRDMADKIKTVAPLTGAAGQQLGKSLLVQMNASIRAAIEADNPELAADIKAFATRFAKLFTGETAAALKNIKVPVTGDDIAKALLPGEIAEARAEAFGSISDQIATKQNQLAALKGQLKRVIKGSEEERDTLNAIAAKEDEIAGIREQQAADVKERNDEADKKVLAALGSEERKRQNALTIAEQTESLADDLRAQVKLRNFYQAKIGEVGRTVRDAEQAREEISALEDKLFDVEQDIIENTREERQRIRGKQSDALDDASERASETETLADDQNWANRKVAFWKRQVELIRALVAKGKASKDELQDALDKLDELEDNRREVARDRRQQIKDLRGERIDLKIQIAQDNENVKAEIRAREEKIRFIQKQIQATKKESIARLRLQAQLSAERKEIKNLKDEDKDKEGRGTTAFDILKQAAETFKRTGGNLINGDQPFAGPTGFVAPIAQWLKSQRSVDGIRGPQPKVMPPPKPPPPTPVRLPKSDATDRNDRAHFTRLIEALDRNTNAITGKGNKGAAPKGTGVNVLLRNDRRFWDGAEARRESGGGV